MALMPGLVARLGGDEFAIFLPQVDGRQQAVAIGRRFHTAIQQAFDLEGFKTEVSASIGIAMCPEQADDVSTLMRYADVAMYHAKSAMLGVSVYSARHDPHSPKRLSLMSDLGPAIRENQLRLNYQPKIEIASGRVYGFEALLRWNHPQLGFIAPGEFIPIAEMTNLIHPMTLWVLEQSIGECARWQRQGHRLGVAVNLSVRNLLDEKIADQLENLLLKHGLAAEWLELENY